MKVLFTRVGPAYDFGGEDVILVLPLGAVFRRWVNRGRGAFEAAYAVQDFSPYELTSFGSSGAFLVAKDSWPQVCEILDLEDVYDMEDWSEAEISAEVWDKLDDPVTRSDLWMTHWGDTGIRFSFHPRYENRVRHTDRLAYSEVL